MFCMESISIATEKNINKMRSLDYEIYKVLTMGKLIPSKVVVSLDGGICSQMHQYLLGQCFAEKGKSVYYDLSFFEEWGSDLDRRFVRNFDLLKAFPYLSFKKASKVMIRVYKRKFFYLGNNTEGHLRIGDYSFLQCTAPVYLGGYYQMPSELWLGKFRQLFKWNSCILDKQNEMLCNEIMNQPYSVAVHVRRGDLRKEVFAYGKPATLTYFQKAIQFFNDKLKMPFFYFFSDEQDWVTKELIPQLPLSGNFQIVDLNGSDKGYMDLCLVSYCKHQITSKGTLGKYGALFGDNPDKYVTLCDDVTEYNWKELLTNPIYL